MTNVKLWVRTNQRPLFPTAMGVLDSKKWPRICSISKYNIVNHLDQVHSKKGARIELKMVPAVLRREIPHVVRFSAQSEQLCESFTLTAIDFWKLRVLGMQAPGAGIAFPGSSHVWSIARIYQNSSDIPMMVRNQTGPLWVRIYSTILGI